MCMHCLACVYAQKARGSEGDNSKASSHCTCMCLLMVDFMHLVCTVEPFYWAIPENEDISLNQTREYCREPDSFEIQFLLTVGSLLSVNCLSRRWWSALPSLPLPWRRYYSHCQLAWWNWRWSGMGNGNVKRTSEVRTNSEQSQWAN